MSWALALYLLRLSRPAGRRRRRRWQVWEAALLLSLASATPSPAYDRDVHLSLTMWLAELASFSENEALQLAKYDQATDDDPETSPWASYESREKYHFQCCPGSSSQERIRQHKSRALACKAGNVTTAEHKLMGQFLHALEDQYAHRTHGPGLGHLFTGTTPDKPWTRPGDFVVMVSAKFAALQETKLKCYKGADQTRELSAGVQRRLELWARDEEDSGFGDPAARDRWSALERELYGDRYSAYKEDGVRSYDEWLQQQKQGGWKKP